MPSGTGNKDRKREIQEAAARLFRKKGYTATTMRMIASAVNMEAASLYNHIESKQALLQSILLEMARLFTEGMAAVCAAHSEPLPRLEALVDLHIRLTLEHPDPISLITGEWVHLEEPALSHYLAQRNAYEQAFRSLLEEGMERGELAKTDAGTALFSVLSTLHWLYSWTARHRDRNEADLRRDLKQTLLQGLISRPPG